MGTYGFSERKFLFSGLWSATGEGESGKAAAEGSSDGDDKRVGGSGKVGGWTDGFENVGNLKPLNECISESLFKLSRNATG